MTASEDRTMAERVWDKFLTERDRAHLAKSRRQPVGFGERPALLLVDLYRWVFGDSPEEITQAVNRWPGSCGPDGWAAVPYIQQLLASARAAEIPIVHMTGLGGCGVPGWSDRKLRRFTEKQSQDADEADRLRRQYDIIDEVAPLPGEAVLHKSSPSSFFGTPLVPFLNLHAVDTVLTVGESTSGCVRASVVDGCTYSYRMIVVEEGVFDRHQFTHAANLFDMHQKYADVLPLVEVQAYLETIAAKKGLKELALTR
jgi:nicotinamidase-related amidase